MKIFRYGRAAGLPAGIFIAVTLAFAFVTERAGAQEWTVVEDDDWCTDVRRDYCEVREITFPADRGDVAVRATNGTISVTGWDRDEIHVKALIRVRGSGRSARETAEQVEISTGATIKASGPHGGWWDFFRGRKWSVSYRVMVPHEFDVDARSTNGGVSVSDVTGAIDVGTTNGGVKLTRVGGDVEGGTTNGGIVVVLEGSTWTGGRLDVHTTNGGVNFTMPEGYSATLDVSTVNGGINVDFPVRIETKRRGRLTGTIGEGGPTFRVKTVNGGVRFNEGR